MSEAILRTKLTGDSAELQRALREGIEAAKEFGDKVKESIKETAVQIAGLVIGVESVREVFDKTFEGVKGVFDLSRDLRNLSNQTGASVRDLVQLRAEFDLSGIAADNVGGILNRMQRTIEQASDKGGPLADMFYRLGLNMYDIQQLNPAQQFELLRQKLTAIEDPARRAQIAMKIFGNFGGGGSVLSVFGNTKIAEEAANIIKRQADILAENAKTFQEVSIQFEQMRMRLEGFFIGIAEPVSRVLLPVLEQLNSLDLTKWGEKIGQGLAEAIGILYNAFESGKLERVIALTFTTGAADAVNIIAGGVYTAFQAIGDVILGVFNSTVLLGIGDAIVGFGEQLYGSALKSLHAFGIISDPNYWEGIADIAAGSFGKLRDTLFHIGLDFGMLLGSIFKNAAAEFAGALQSIFSKIPALAGLAGQIGGAIAGMLNPQDMAVAGAQASGNVAAAAKALGSESSDDLINKGIAKLEQAYKDPNLYDKIGDALKSLGAQAQGESATILKAAITELMQKLKSDLAASKPLDIIGDDGKALREALLELKGLIPKGQAGEKPRGGDGSDFSGYGRGENISGFYGNSSGFHGAYAFAPGPVNIESGIAGRAGRIVGGPKSVEENTTQMVTSLNSIDKKLGTFSAPS